MIGSNSIVLCKSRFPDDGRRAGVGDGLIWIFLGGDFLVGEDAVLMEGVLVERFIVFAAVTNATSISPMLEGGACVRCSKMIFVVVA